MAAKILFIALFAFFTACTKVEPEQLPKKQFPPELLEPPISIDQLDLNQFDKEDEESEVLSPEQRDKAIQALIDTARLTYLNKKLVSAETTDRSNSFKIDALNEASKPISFDLEPLAMQILEQVKDKSLCNLNYTEDFKTKPFQQTLTTEGASCPLKLSSARQGLSKFGESQIYKMNRTGQLYVRIHPELIPNLTPPSIASIRITSEEDYASQSFKSPSDAHRSYSAQMATGDLTHSDGSLIPYQHHLKTVFEITQKQSATETQFRSAHVHQVKFVLEGKTIIFTMKKNSDESPISLQCRVNRTQLTLGECVLVFLQFAHF